MIMFVGRKQELDALEDLYKKNKNGIIVIYGRRRIGKTTLVLKFLERKQGIYFLAKESPLKENIKALANEIADFLKSEWFKKVNYNSFEELFADFSQQIKNRQKIIIVIDEFPYLIKSQKGIVSEFQRIWDLYLSKLPIFLIILGSSISVMETKVLDYKSPLYGRRIGQLKLEPLKVTEIYEFLNKSLDDVIKIYAVADGIPLYLNFFKHLNFEEALKTHALNKAGFLNQEAIFLLRSELRELSVYLDILKSIAFGKNKFGEISNFIQLKSTKLTPYLKNLIELHIIQKMYPVTEKETRNAKFEFVDNYFRFWFRFIYPNLQALEYNKIDDILKIIKSNFNQYLGFIFEKFVRNFVFEFYDYVRVGKWWHKDKEIDVVAINEFKNEILFAECKWMSNVNAKKVLKELKEKAKYVQWNIENRKEKYAIFAKSFKTKTNEATCIDLNEMERMIRK